MKETGMYSAAESNEAIKSLVEGLRKAGYPNSSILDFVASEHPEKASLIKVLKESYSNEAILTLLVSESVPIPVQQPSNGKELISENELIIRVTDILRQIGIPARLAGYHYVRTAIVYAFKDRKIMGGVTKILYPTVGKEYSTKANCVERSIRTAIEVAWEKGEPDAFKDYFGYNRNDGNRKKPENGEFIALISDMLRLKYDLRS